MVVLRAVALLTLLADGLADSASHWRPIRPWVADSASHWKPADSRVHRTNWKQGIPSKAGTETHWKGGNQVADSETHWNTKGKKPGSKKNPGEKPRPNERNSRQQPWKKPCRNCRTEADQQTDAGLAGAAVKAWSKEDQDAFGIQQSLDNNHNATLAPGLVLSQAIVMAVPNGGISVMVQATVLSEGTATNEALTTTIALLLHVPASTISSFEVRPTPYGTVGLHFYLGNNEGTPCPGESKKTIELVLVFAVAAIALVLLLHAVAMIVSRCQVPKNNNVEVEAPKSNDVELEAPKSNDVELEAPKGNDV